MIKGKQAFIAYYRSLFGDRTDSLLQSLTNNYLPVLLIRMDKVKEIQERWSGLGYTWKNVSWFSQAIEWPTGIPFGTRLPGSAEGWLYPLSPSSLLPVKALAVKPGEKVLDACAAPGGKTVAMAYDKPQQIVSNDISGDRVMRMKKVVRDMGIEDMVEVQMGPAEYIARLYPEYFDKILVDAPCSSEAHVWRSKEHLDAWSHKRVEQLHTRQVNLVKSLISALKPGGRLVYSTCALTPEENEETVKSIPIKVEQMKRVWPDSDGMDTMFVACFEKQL